MISCEFFYVRLLIAISILTLKVYLSNKINIFCRNLCSESLQLFKDLHLTYLNQGDPDEAIQNYKRYGCYDNIADSLGYRLALESVCIISKTDCLDFNYWSEIAIYNILLSVNNMLSTY